MICELTDYLKDELEGDERQWYFYVNGFVSYIRNDEKSIYPACPDESCKRKIVSEGDGTERRWRCEHCQRTYKNCVPTYMLLAKISDLTDSIYVQFYKDMGTKLMGVEAREIRVLKEEGKHKEANEMF